jgi:hypothetical protein
MEREKLPIIRSAVKTRSSSFSFSFFSVFSFAGSVGPRVPEMVSMPFS